MEEREQPRPETDEGIGDQDGDDGLDDALEGTFPASDPISPEDPGR